MKLITFHKSIKGWRRCITDPDLKTKKYGNIFKTRKQARNQKSKSKGYQLSQIIIGETQIPNKITEKRRLELKARIKQLNANRSKATDETI